MEQFDLEFIKYGAVSHNVLVRKKAQREKWISQYKYRIKDNNDYHIYCMYQEKKPETRTLMKAKMETRLLRQAIKKLQLQVQIFMSGTTIFVVCSVLYIVSKVISVVLTARLGRIETGQGCS